MIRSICIGTVGKDNLFTGRQKIHKGKNMQLWKPTTVGFFLCIQAEDFIYNFTEKN